MSKNADITYSGFLVSRENFLVSIATHCQAPAMAHLMRGKAEEKELRRAELLIAALHPGRDETDVVTAICTHGDGSGPSLGHRHSPTCQLCSMLSQKLPDL